MKKYLLFRNLTKRVIVPLVLSITLILTQMRLQYSDVPNTQNYIKEVNKMKKLFFAALIGIMLLQAGSITTKAENIPHIHLIFPENAEFLPHGN